MSNVIIEDVFRTVEFERNLQRTSTGIQASEECKRSNKWMIVVPLILIALGLLIIVLAPKLEKLVMEWQEKVENNKRD